MADFTYQEPFPLGKDRTKYLKIEGSETFVSTDRFNDREILKIDPEGLTILAKAAMKNVSFLLRSAHNEQVARILDDPESSANEKGVALAFLKNAEVASQFELPLCQDTGTAIIMGKKGENVWTGADDSEALSKGVFLT
jgi:fumarate hydratase class I